MPFRDATALVSGRARRRDRHAGRHAARRRPDRRAEDRARAGARTSTSACSRCAGACATCRGIRFFTWGWKEPLRLVARASGTKAANTRRRPRWSTSPSRRSSSAWRRSRSASPAHELQVSVTTDKPQYPVRQKAHGAHQGRRTDGKPLAGAEVAFAAVDEGLLALRANDSWDLLDAMLQQRAWGVETCTAQSEIIGRRHYGRKAVPAGGGGGEAPTRELFDTLLLWKPRRGARRQRRGRGRGAAQRFADQLPARRGRRRRRAAVRHRQRQHPRHAGPADAQPACRRWCARATSSARC